MAQLTERRAERPRDIQPVINKLTVITHDLVRPRLDQELAAKHAVDPKAGIVLINLSDIAPVQTEDGLQFHFHGARILPGGYVNPHYHKIGEEPYHILTGDAGTIEMNLGAVTDGTVEWRTPEMKSVDDVIVVRESEVHSLRNTGTTPLDFTFACPEGHLIDDGPKQDRYFTNGLPPQYPKA